MFIISALQTVFLPDRKDIYLYFQAYFVLLPKFRRISPKIIQFRTLCIAFLHFVYFPNRSYFFVFVPSSFHFFVYCPFSSILVFIYMLKQLRHIAQRFFDIHIYPK